MRLFVTGGAGFIGSAYVRNVLAGRYPSVAGAEVTVLDKLTYAGNPANLPIGHPRLRFVLGDACDRALLDEVLPGHDAVLHFAAESHVDRSIARSADFFVTNVVGTGALLEAALRAGVDRVVHVSTDEVYGEIEEGSWTEDHPLEPNSPYAASKAGADLVARAFHRTHGLPVSITRCCNTYGPYQVPEKIIPRFLTSLLQDGTVPLYGDGEHVREWLHVEDHCRAIQLVLEAGEPGGVYNIGEGVALSNRELTARLLEACGAGWDRVRTVDDRKGHDRRYSLDATRIRRELGFRPEIPFDEGLADTVRWYRRNRAWWEPYTSRRAAARRTGTRVPAPLPAHLPQFVEQSDDLLFESVVRPVPDEQ